jgi:hypothetical protein
MDPTEVRIRIGIWISNTDLYVISPCSLPWLIADGNSYLAFVLVMVTEAKLYLAGTGTAQAYLIFYICLF